MMLNRAYTRKRNPRWSGLVALGGQSRSRACGRREGISVVVGVCLVGGSANNGANSGPFYVNSNNAWSITNSNYGARHTYNPVIVIPDSYGAANPLSLDPGGRSHRRVRTSRMRESGPLCRSRAGLM